MGDDAIHKAAAIAAIAILLILAIMIRAGALFPCGRTPEHGPTRSTSRAEHTRWPCPSLRGPPPTSKLWAADVQLPNRSQPAYHVRPVHSVASLCPPPPAYPAHHPDARFDLVGYGSYSIGNSGGGAVDVVPPPYTADPSGDGQPL